MSIFRRDKDPRGAILRLKNLKINGMEFTIKAVNPLIDFAADKIPQIFTDWVTARKIEPKAPDVPDLKKLQQDMYAVIQAGVDKPKLHKNSNDGLTVEDLFRDPTMGVKLYYEILEHSLNRFRGLNRLFFSIGIRSSRLMLCASDTLSALQHTSLRRETSA
jgi:hypothetical protein